MSVELVWLAAGVLPAIMVLRAVAGVHREQEASASGGRPSSVCPDCGRGSTAPHKAGCPWRR